MEKTRPACAIVGCSSPVKAKGLCRKHYLRLHRTGSPHLKRIQFPTGVKCRVPDCYRPARARGFCTMHYRREKLHGDPAHVEDRTKPIQDRLMEKLCVDESTCCWEWLGWRDDKGYGKIWSDQTMEGAHRVSYRLHVGEIPLGMCVLHRCDNPGCVNPGHLFLGTHQENMDDMRNKNRRSRSPLVLRGEASPVSKLTREAVVGIKQRLASGHQCSDIARDVGCDRTTISHIKLGKSWRSI